MDERRDPYTVEERRLVAALEARARGVTEADLRPPAPPGRDTVLLRSPARWLPALAAAAAAVVVFTLFLVIGQPGRTPPVGPPGPSSPPSPSAPASRSADPSPSPGTPTPSVGETPAGSGPGITPGVEAPGVTPGTPLPGVTPEALTPVAQAARGPAAGSDGGGA